MSAYNVFIKNINNLDGKSITGSDLRVLDGSVIKRDALAKATSKLNVLKMPSAVEIGDVCGVYDEYGTIVYLGRVMSINGNTINADQIQSLFDDKWLYNNPNEATIEETLKTILINDYQNSSDTLLASIFSPFNITTSSSTNLTLPTEENDKATKNFMSFIFDIYESYGILFDISIPFESGTPTIKIGKPDYEKLLLGNNTEVLREFDIDRETQQTNKLVIYDKDGLNIRETYYATTSGITTDSSSLNRLPLIKTDYVFSDDPLDDLVAQKLRNDMYNHQIQISVVFQNRLFDFSSFKLGQPFDIYYNSQYYNSIMTGFELNINENGISQMGKLVFGLVRQSLTKKLFKYES